MRYEFAQIDGLSTLFNNRDDMLNSTFRSDISDSIDINTTIYVRCLPTDADIFGEEFVGGSTWVITHGMVVGDAGALSILRDYTKGTDSEITPTDTIQEAIAKLDARSAENANDWIIIP